MNGAEDLVRGELVWMRELDADRCWKLLERRTVGRVGFASGAEQIILPVNYVADRQRIVIRAGRTEMLDILGPGAVAAFEVDETDGFSETGWSVLVKGDASEVTDPVERFVLERLPLHAWAPGPHDRWIKIVPRTLTGRAISRRTGPEGQFLPYMPPD